MSPCNSENPRNNAPVGSCLILPVNILPINVNGSTRGESKEDPISATSAGRPAHDETTDSSTDSKSNGTNWEGTIMESPGKGFCLTHVIPLRVLPQLDSDGQGYIVTRSGVLLTATEFRNARPWVRAMISLGASILLFALAAYLASMQAQA